MNQSIKKLQLRISKFCEDRDWNQFHSPKSLAMSISIEAAELLENFQWSKDDAPISTTNKESISDWRTDQLVNNGIAYVPQVDNVFPSLSIFENLQMGAYTRNDNKEINIYA